MGGDLTGTASNAQIASGAIVNADVSAGAAIAKSKLAGLAIADADVAAGAAIAKSKLASLAIVDADVASNAAIQESKLALIDNLQEPFGPEPGIVVSGTALTANHMRGVRYTVPKTGSITGMCIYVQATGGNYYCAVYDMSATNLVKQAESPLQAASGANTWQNNDFSVALSVTKGQKFYFCVHSDNAALFFGRTGLVANIIVGGPLPAGYLSGADAANMRCWNWNRGSFSAPPTNVPVASIAGNQAFVFFVKYA